MGERHNYGRLRRNTLEVGERFTAWVRMPFSQGQGHRPELVIVKSISDRGHPSFTDQFGKDWTRTVYSDELTRSAYWHELDWELGDDGSIAALDSLDVVWSIHRSSAGHYSVRRDDDPSTDSGDFRTLTRAMNGAEIIASRYWADVDKAKKVERKQRATAKRESKA